MRSGALADSPSHPAGCPSPVWLLVGIPGSGSPVLEGLPPSFWSCKDSLALQFQSAAQGAKPRSPVKSPRACVKEDPVVRVCTRLGDSSALMGRFLQMGWAVLQGKQVVYAGIKVAPLPGDA